MKKNIRELEKEYLHKMYVSKKILENLLYEYFTHIHAHVVFVKRYFFPGNFLYKNLKGTEQTDTISVAGVSFKSIEVNEKSSVFSNHCCMKFKQPYPDQ